MTNLKNHTGGIEFLILGFHNLGEFKIPLFILLLIIYMLTCFENLMIVVLVNISTHLQYPMYFLISNLSFCELLFTTNLVPLMLHDILSGKGIISQLGCVIQLNVLGYIANLQSFLLALMSYDRYLAISKPLRYSEIIHNKLCFHIIIGFWLSSLPIELVTSVLESKLEFCGPTVIDHFHCDFTAFVSLTCSDITFLMTFIVVVSATLLVVPFTFIILSYTFIIYTILKIRSSTGRQRAFSTCSSHLLVVTIYYATLITIYVLPQKANSLHINKGLSFVYFAVTPMINPIIYTLRNKDIHKALQTVIREIKQF